MESKSPSKGGQWRWIKRDSESIDETTRHEENVVKKWARIMLLPGPLMAGQNGVNNVMEMSEDKV